MKVRVSTNTGEGRGWVAAVRGSHFVGTSTFAADESRGAGCRKNAERRTKATEIKLNPIRASLAASGKVARKVSINSMSKSMAGYMPKGLKC
jgi:hypothetical protein